MFIQPAVQIYILAFFCSNLKEQNNEQLSVFYMSSFMKCFHHKNFCLLVWETPWNLLKLYTFSQMLSQYNHACMIARLQMNSGFLKFPSTLSLLFCPSVQLLPELSGAQTIKKMHAFCSVSWKKNWKKKLWQKKDSAT